MAYDTMSDIKVFVPTLPTAERLLPYLDAIDARHWYTNHGPLLTRFEVLLAEHFSIDPECVVTAVNGTAALTQILKALGVAKETKCVMPSWSFVATAGATDAAALVPFFADVDRESWSLNPKTATSLLRETNVGAVMPVFPFGSPIDLAGWDEFYRSTNVPVVVDGAAAFDTLAMQIREVGIGCNPIMVSLHATKVFGVGEGAAILVKDRKLAGEIRKQGNFGFSGSREALLAGINTKLSEYTAAIGLAAFAEWNACREQWHELSDAFADGVAGVEKVRLMPKFNEGWVSSYGVIELDTPYIAEDVAAGLAKYGIETRAWWGGGCHRHAAYMACPRATDLRHTDYLGSHVLGLPFWRGLNASQLSRIFDALRSVLDTLSNAP
jgi:dTDP-4-amino-4,6-dideoxygalactose transaminase